MKLQSKNIERAIAEFEVAIAQWGNRDRARNDKQQGWNKAELIKLNKIFSYDRKCLRNVLSLFRRGKFTDAWNKARRLDTIVRDVIPNIAWNLMKSLG